MAEQLSSYETRSTGLTILKAEQTGEKQVTLYLDAGHAPVATDLLGVFNVVSGTASGNTIGNSYSGSYGVEYVLAADGTLTSIAAY